MIPPSIRQGQQLWYFQHCPAAEGDDDVDRRAGDDDYGDDVLGDDYAEGDGADDDKVTMTSWAN